MRKAFGQPSRWSRVQSRDNALSTALQQNGILLDEEPYADWAIAPREALELLRQRARLELARDRTRGFGRSETDAVIDAWEDCLAHDPASEEAASALMRVYAATGQRQLASSTFERCRAAVGALGLAISPALEEAKGHIGELAVATHAPARSREVVAPEAYRGKDERRLISVLFAQFSGLFSWRERQDPEEAKRRSGNALAGAIAEVEALGGTVMSVSGAGLAALLVRQKPMKTTPNERSGLPSGCCWLSAKERRVERSRLSLRIGIETGSAVVGPLWPATGAGYGAAGPVVEAAAALQSAAKPGSVLVGPGTRPLLKAFSSRAPPGSRGRGRAKPMQATYLVRPKRPSPWLSGRPGCRTSGRLVGRQSELAALEEVAPAGDIRDGFCRIYRGRTWTGQDPPGTGMSQTFHGLGRCRHGTLPLWLEGRCASYASSTPYGLYRRLLSAWVGIAPEDREETSDQLWNAP